MVYVLHFRLEITLCYQSRLALIVKYNRLKYCNDLTPPPLFREFKEFITQCLGQAHPIIIQQDVPALF